MRIIVPMAGMGKRMRPHTLTTPKPLLHVAGKPIVQRLVEDIAGLMDETLEEVAFIIGDFGNEVEQQLIKVAETLGAKGSIYHQDEALGTAHAILCAEQSLEGKVIVAFADTLFRADFKLDEQADGVLWVNQIDDPSAFGVIKMDDNGVIVDFVEKPETFVSDLAMIGIYYFKDGANLRSELRYLIDNDIINGGEYQLPDALRNMTQKGLKFVPGEVSNWMDCGNKNATVDTNQQVLKFSKENLVDASSTQENSVIIPPCFIGKNVVLKNAVVGPYVSVGDDSTITESVVSNSIIGQSSHLKALNMADSMLGNYSSLTGKTEELSIGDYATY